MHMSRRLPPGLRELVKNSVDSGSRSLSALESFQLLSFSFPVSSKEEPTFVQVDMSFLEGILPLRPIGADVRLLLIEWGLAHVVDAHKAPGKPLLITKVEVAFPGPFMRVATKRRTYYFAWDSTELAGIEIMRHEYPRTAKVSESITFIPTGDSGTKIGSVLAIIQARLGAANSN